MELGIARGDAAAVQACIDSGVQFLPYAEENGWDELQQLFLEYAQNEDSE